MVFCHRRIVFNLLPTASVLFCIAVIMFVSGRRKVEATRKLTWGKYYEVKEMMLRYEKLHFSNSCGAKRSIKAATRRTVTRRKVRTVEKLLCWLVDDCHFSSIKDLVGRVDRLGRDINGYFALNWRVTSSKGAVIAWHLDLSVHTYPSSLVIHFLLS